MLERIVDFSVLHRWPVVISAVLALAVSVASIPRLAVDAVPDVTNVIVIVLTEAPGFSAAEVERLATIPVENGLNGIPNLAQMRSVSRGDLSAVTLVFSDDTDIWFARQLVSERLREIEARIPDTVGRPQLAPVSTGLGEIYQFVLGSDRRSPMELRTMLEWDIGPRLRGVPGVIEVNALGGAAKEIHVVLDPHQLAAHGLTVPEVIDALRANDASVGGGYVERGPEALVIRGEGRFRDVADIGAVVVSTDADGTPVLLRHLGEVRIGAALPQGVVTRDGRGEVVTGIVMMLVGQSSRDVVHGVHARIDEIRATLPDGARIDTVYDRASFIDRTLATVAKNLVEGLLLVTLVLVVLLGSPRASVIVATGIPFAMGLAILGMIALHVTGNLMSLGAIDFGLLVDGPIVMAEAALAYLAVERAETVAGRRDAVRRALGGVARPVVFAVTIVLLVYLPLLALEGMEGKMFRPMATTMALALGGSVVFALVVFPAACAIVMPHLRAPKGPTLLARLAGPYRRSLDAALRRPALVLGGALAALTLCVPVGAGLGADFVPRIDEGDIVVSIRRLPSIGPTEARRLDLAVENVLRDFPEVMTSVGMTGRGEVAVDPVGMESSDILVRLRPHDEWRTAHDMDALGEAMKRAIESRVPSTFVSISQPIEDRTNEIVSGSRADVAVHLFGLELETMTRLARQIAASIARVPGAGDVRFERALGLPQRTVRPDRARLARYGVSTRDVLSAVEASRIGSPAGILFDEHRRFDVRVLLPPLGGDAASFARLPVGARGDELIPLGQVADVVDAEGPAQISRENRERRLRVEVNIRGRDLVSFVADAKEAVAHDVPLPDGYRLEWGGTFRSFERARDRLLIVVPMALAIVLAMLYFAFGAMRPTLAVFAGIPFALIGGVAALALRGLPFSIPAAVGFIALSGIAVLNGVVMTSDVRRRIASGDAIDLAVRDGATHTLAAVVLTALVAALGFLPMALSTSAGSEVQRPLATVVIGGLVSSTGLGLYVLPVLLRWLGRPS